MFVLVMAKRIVYINLDDQSEDEDATDIELEFEIEAIGSPSPKTSDPPCKDSNVVVQSGPSTNLPPIYECEQVTPTIIKLVKSDYKEGKELKCIWPGCDFTSTSSVDVGHHKLEEVVTTSYKCYRLNCNYETSSRDGFVSHLKKH